MNYEYLWGLFKSRMMNYLQLQHMMDGDESFRRYVLLQVTGE